MNRKLHLSLLGGMGLASLIACAAVEGPAAQDEHKGHAAGQTPSMQLHRLMVNNSSDMPMTGDVDKDFASMMQMHHKQAIEMVDVLLAHGDDEALKAMARKMKQQQQQEMAELEKHK